MAELMLALATSGVSPLGWDDWRESRQARSRNDRAAS
jgi:hypothetical protein